MCIISRLPFIKTPPSLVDYSKATTDPLIEYLAANLLHANTKLLVAARRGDFEEVRAQIAQGGDVDHQNGRG